MLRRAGLAAILAVLVTALAAAPAAGSARTIKKAIWGPAFFNGVSEFPIYHDLGVGIYETNLDWDEVVDHPPADPRDPNDPAYHWDLRVDRAIEQARRYHIRVALLLQRSVPWANGGQDKHYAPDPAAFADWVTAVARRYRSVHLWMIWGEPTRGDLFKPADDPRSRARRYAQILDAAYGALKAVNSTNKVIGGMSWTGGDFSTYAWVRSMVLPNGRRPRMDMWGHNPFPFHRPPDLRDGVIQPQGFVDFGGLDSLARWLDRFFPRRHLPLFLAEFATVAAPGDTEFVYYVSPRAQADYVKRALRITRQWSRIYTLGYVHLRDFDDPFHARSGLIDLAGHRRPAYYAFRRG